MLNYEDIEKGTKIWLKEFCDLSLSGADLVCDAIYAAKNELATLRRENEILRSNQYSNFEKFAHDLNHNLLCNEIDKLKIQRDALRLHLLKLTRNIGCGNN